VTASTHTSPTSPDSTQVTASTHTSPTSPDSTRGTASGGSGLTGLTERLVAAGGSLTAGARARGGFDVTAELPLDAEDERPTGAGEFRGDADVYVGR
ncbi:hypothetical protein ACIBQ5_03175, partial [Streptomyces massasporeus]